MPDVLSALRSIGARRRNAAASSAAGPPSRRRVGLAVALALVILVVALLVTLLQEAPRRVGTNGRSTAAGVVVPPGSAACQFGETVPAKAASLEVLASTAGQPAGPLEVVVRSADGSIVSRGRSAAGFVDATVQVPMQALARAASPARVCVRNAGRQEVALLGDTDSPNGEPPVVRGRRNGDMAVTARLEWFGGGERSWLDIAPQVVERASLFKASAIGTWTVWLALVVLALAGLGAALLAIREASTDAQRPRGRVRWPLPALWTCVLLATLNAGVWAVVTPSFQVPDETAHSGYVQYLAERGEVPSPSPGFAPSSPDLEAAYFGVPFSILGKPSWLPASDRAFRDRVRGIKPVPNSTEAGYVANNPPLYYALATVPYRLAGSGSFLDRLFAMRLLGCLLAGLTTGFVFCFLRELVPRSGWAWSTGACVVAFQPVFAFVSGGVNNDTLLWTASAGLFLALARTFRRGLTARRGAAIGASVAAGLLAKNNVIGFIPGVLIALGLLALLSPRPDRRRALAGIAVAVATATILVVGTFAIVQALGSAGAAPSAATGSVGNGSYLNLGAIREQLVYLWQSFLPRLPFMQDQFTGYPDLVLWQTYFQGLVGRFGWFQFGFAPWVNDLALWTVLLLMALAVRTLVVARRTLRTRWIEPVTYLALLVGTAGLVAVVSYRYRRESGSNFEQARYLLPLLPLYGGFAVLAAKGAGRFAPVLGALMVVAAFGHDVFSVLLSFQRYYT